MNIRLFHLIFKDKQFFLYLHGLASVSRLDMTNANN
jgi:hypothetical protein